jgi:hypothetical protein
MKSDFGPSFRRYNGRCSDFHGFARVVLHGHMQLWRASISLWEWEFDQPIPWLITWRLSIALSN